VNRKTSEKSVEMLMFDDSPVGGVEFGGFQLFERKFFE